MKCLIVGLGFSKLYKKILINLGSEVITVSQTPGKADFITVEDAIEAHRNFDIALVCTPNFTHEKLTYAVAPHSRIVLVEKPGFKYRVDWQQLVKDFPHTRFMMIKNNQWRDNIADLKSLADKSTNIKLYWINKGQTPEPGRWLTNKAQSYGGVSRDLMTHLLSIFQSLNHSYATSALSENIAEQRYYLDDDSDYDVDDICKFTFTDQKKTWTLLGDWKDINGSTNIIRTVTFELAGGKIETVDIGQCSEDAYQAMFEDAIKNVDNNSFWLLQLRYDLWIHKKIEQLSGTRNNV